jgi:hypothetical protein
VSEAFTTFLERRTITLNKNFLRIVFAALLFVLSATSNAKPVQDTPLPIPLPGGPGSNSSDQVNLQMLR